MKVGRPLPDLACELERQASAKLDFLAQVRSLRLSSNGYTSLFLRDEPYPVSDIAHGQLAEYAGVPKPFYDRLRGATEDLRVTVSAEPHRYEPKNEPLFDTVVNTLLQARGEELRLVRTLDGNARAFLSDSYNPDLDNFDVFRVAARAIGEAGLGPENVLSAEVTERKLYLKVVSPKLEAAIDPANLHRPHGGHHYLKEPQVVQAGVVISNSEVGLGSLSVQPMVCKLMCTNLWIMEEGLRARHIGKTLEADVSGTIFKSDTRIAEAKARLLKIRDHMEAALDTVRFQSLVERMQASTEVRLEGQIEKVAEATARRFALKESEKEQVVRHLIEGADLSLWGLSNALTATAQQVESYDRATELETLGGRMLLLPKGEVQDLVRAA